MAKNIRPSGVIRTGHLVLERQTFGHGSPFEQERAIASREAGRVLAASSQWFNID